MNKPNSTAGDGGVAYCVIDGPGITGMGSQWRAKMDAHIAAGGSFLHPVRKDGTLEHPERMWPDRGLEGRRVRLDGTVVD